MTQKKRFALLRLTVVCLLLSLCSLALGAKAPPAENVQQQVVLDILTLNDFHGALLRGNRVPGAAKVAAVIQTMRQNNPNGTLVLGAGDLFQGSVESNLTLGSSTMAVLNGIGMDATAVGNHEFDWGVNRLDALTREAVFPFVAANVRDRASGRDLSFLAPYQLMETAGLHVGILGLTTGETQFKTHPRNVEGLLFTDPAAEARTYIPLLRDQGADIIVVLAHLGSQQDKATGKLTGEGIEFLRGVPPVEVLVTGHTHAIVAGEWQGTAVVQAGSAGRGIGHIRLIVDARSRQVLERITEVIDVAARPEPEDERIAGLLATELQTVEATKRQPVGELAVELSHDRWQLSPFGVYVDDALRKATGAEVAFINGGGVRTSLAQGELTLGQLYAALPFDNTVMLAQLTGGQIRAILEYGLLNQQIGCLQFSGLQVRYDQGLPLGQRVREVRLADGRLLAETQRYNVATNDFMLSGGDGYYQFAAGEGIQDTHMLVRDIVQETLRREGKTLSNDKLQLNRLQLGTRPVKEAA